MNIEMRIIIPAGGPNVHEAIGRITTQVLDARGKINIREGDSGTSMVEADARPAPPIPVQQ